MRKLLLSLALALILLLPLTLSAAEKYTLLFARQLQNTQVEGETVYFYQVGPKQVSPSRVLTVGTVGTWEIIMYGTTNRSLVKKARKYEGYLGSSFGEVSDRAACGYGAGGFTAEQLVTAIKAMKRVIREGPELDEQGEPVFDNGGLTIAQWEALPAGERGTFLGTRPPVEILGAEFSD